jgi:hypothetical protein
MPPDLFVAFAMRAVLQCNYNLHKKRLLSARNNGVCQMFSTERCIPDGMQIKNSKQFLNSKTSFSKQNNLSSNIND